MNILEFNLVSDRISRPSLAHPEVTVRIYELDGPAPRKDVGNNVFMILPKMRIITCQSRGHMTNNYSSIGILGGNRSIRTAAQKIVDEEQLFKMLTNKYFVYPPNGRINTIYNIKNDTIEHE